MPETVQALGVYVVELEVEGVACLTVYARSRDEACELAETQVRPSDVSELDVAEVARVVSVPPIGKELRGAKAGRAPEKGSKGSRRRADS